MAVAVAVAGLVLMLLLFVFVTTCRHSADRFPAQKYSMN